jgi:hypothetical protein
MLQEMARALAVLSLFFFVLSTASPGIASTSIVVREAGIVATLVTDICGHDQPGIACHAPNSCCRPDQAIMPPQRVLAERAFVAVEAVAFDIFRPVPIETRPMLGFRSRGPPTTIAV